MTRSAAPEPPLAKDEAGSTEKYLTLFEHLQELRHRVVISALAVVAGLAVSAYFGEDIINFLKEPAEKRVDNIQMQFIEPFELFVTYFRVALLGGIVIAMPVIVFEALGFVTPGLKPGERRGLRDCHWRNRAVPRRGCLRLLCCPSAGSRLLAELRKRRPGAAEYTDRQLH
jgi:hypothetical protein